MPLRGMQVSATGTIHGRAYVVAENPELAYKIVKKYVDEKDLGFCMEREMESVRLLADEDEYPDCGMRLYIDPSNLRLEKHG